MRGMTTTRKYITAVVVGALLAVVVVAWYYSENFTGRVNLAAERIGSLIIEPGHLVDGFLSGADGGFGDWRDPVIKITVSHIAWFFLPIIGIWRMLRNSPSNSTQGVCRACGYNLTGNVSGHCPECGTAVPAQETPASDRR